MYRFQKTGYGFHLMLVGYMEKEELLKWKREGEIYLAGNIQQGFSVLVDITLVKTIPVECKQVIVDVQKMFRQYGMNRSAVILSDKIVYMQFRKIASESGIESTERYILTSDYENAEKVALDWILNRVDPDKKS